MLGTHGVHLGLEQALHKARQVRDQIRDGSDHNGQDATRALHSFSMGSLDLNLGGEGVGTSRGLNISCALDFTRLAP